jgi:hypothetical protein
MFPGVSWPSRSNITIGVDSQLSSGGVTGKITAESPTPLFFRVVFLCCYIRLSNSDVTEHLVASRQWRAIVLISPKNRGDKKRGNSNCGETKINLNIIKFCNEEN